MSIPQIVLNMFRAKGVSNGFRRLGTVISRFGLTPDRQIRALRLYASLLKPFGMKATFFIPADIVARHADVIKELAGENIEWGIHGFSHLDYSLLDAAQVREHIDSAVRAFDAAGIPFSGFRAPYLRPHPSIRRALLDSGRFLYDSSNSVMCDEVYSPRERAFRWAHAFYRPELHSQLNAPPSDDGQLAEFRVLLPDDEMLLERERFDSPRIGSLWKEMLIHCHEKDELFVLQLHPERIHALHMALSALIEESCRLRPPVWRTHLADAARREKKDSSPEERRPAGFRGALCVTGDIDSLTIADFIKR
jgi:hypothetical protein